jgi:hypothetical protein
MSPGSGWAGTPRQSIEAECARRGRSAVVTGCVALLHGDDSDNDLIMTLGGSPARRMISGESRADAGAWCRVWATRGLLWAWEDSATPALRAALSDAAWRVREMAAKVVARHQVSAAFGDVVAMRRDTVQRVRVAAQRAVERLTASGL